MASDKQYLCKQQILKLRSTFLLFEHVLIHSFKVSEIYNTDMVNNSRRNYSIAPEKIK
jgi:hypothetical protein